MHPTVFKVLFSPRRLPHLRGKVRLLLAAYRMLGLDNQGRQVETTLHRPIPYRVCLDLRCLHERMAYFMDGYEMDTVRFLLKLFDRSGCFLDIGANIGLITLPFSLLASRNWSSVDHQGGPMAYGVEPVSSNFDMLCHHVSLNDCQRFIRPLPHAVGEREKTVQIQVEGNLGDHRGTGTANILPAQSGYEGERIELPITTVDNLVRSREISPRVSLVKIDTDGYDLFALMGAVELLKTARPIVYGEFMAHCMRWHGQSVNDAVDFAQTFDYESFMRVGRTWRFAPIQDASGFFQDLLLVPKERVPSIDWCFN